MCGIAGFLEACGQSSMDEMLVLTRDMTGTLRHRGPDDEGAWADAEAGVALGHRRLSIVDLSPEGHQPMQSACGRYIICFNGEVYNFRELRAELEAESGDGVLHWRGHSDTEIMLAAITRWGVDGAVRRFDGMFAFALWDRRERVLYLVRDRLGKKPLYYGWMGGTFLFGSELKALRAHPSFNADINRDAVALLLRHCYIPSPQSIWKGVSKLLPGTVLAVDGSHPGRLNGPTPYWSMKTAAENGISDAYRGTMDDAVDDLEQILMTAVGNRMIADVPLGAFLSGGIDSSLVVALMQARSDRPVRTFTIGFWEKEYNEAQHASLVAAHLGTDHTELYVTPRDALDVIPYLPELFDEPFSDSSQIPTFLVSKMAREHVTVALSGDGGDEFFFGYPRYFKGRRFWERVGWMTPSQRRAIAGVAGLVPARHLDAVLRRLGPIVPRHPSGSPIGGRIRRIAETVGSESAEHFYWKQFCHWPNSASVVLGSEEPSTSFSDTLGRASVPDLPHAMMYSDSVAYLPDDILVKVDRASMSVSLESRAPLLDHHVVEFAWRLPLEMKEQDGSGKAILRNLLYRYVPRELIDRPKKGFGVPIDSWLRGPLRGWAEDLLNESRLKKEGFLDPRPIREKWAEHLSEARNWQYHLWDVLMFQAWLERCS